MKKDRFPCLSIRQPWVDLILWNVKDVENRTKVTHFRGTILVHALAGKVGVSAENFALIERVAQKHGKISPNKPYEPERGAILGMVDIVDCVTKSKSEYFQGPYGWLLANPVLRMQEYREHLTI